MADILQEIIAHKSVEIESRKAVLPYSALEKQLGDMLDTPCPSMQQALMSSPSGIIAEFKRKSPSKGWIKESGQAAEIPLSYQQNGASALSILTDTAYFGGEDSFISAARQSGVTIPVLYKNFVIDEYQLLQARLCGASASLLIAACLTKERYRDLLREAHNLGLEVLLEMHSESELDYASIGADMYGINNRNLGTFITDVQNSYRLSSLLPQDACRVSESGISNPRTVSELRHAGFNGFLIGENFMKEENPGKALKDFIDEITD